MGTEHYQFKQWEDWERPGRAGLNAALAAVDAALYAKADQSTADGLSGQTAALRSRCAALEGRLEVVTGSYLGDDAAARTIDLGFTPEAVLVEYPTGGRSGGNNSPMGGIALHNQPGGGATVVTGGFQVRYVSNQCYTNQGNKIYRYWALK